MEIAVTARHTTVTDRFRKHLAEKLAKIENLAQHIDRVDVRISHEANPRLADMRERIEITVKERGLVVRAEAAADDLYAALDIAQDKLVERLRRARDRRKPHHNRRAAQRVTPPQPAPEMAPEPVTSPEDQAGSNEEYSPVVIRRKSHFAEPMSLDDALYEMELVGHDFYLFEDVETGLPTVVYRRHGWSYGVIDLSRPGQTPTEVERTPENVGAAS